MERREVTPNEEPRNGLKVRNSLSGGQNLVPFRTKDGSNKVSRYNCGPTVYDVSHVGHARNYLTFDILRRILEDYFGYDVKYVMNVTDVDDKIIHRARRNFLLDQYRYRQASKEPTEVYEDIILALEAEISKQKKKVAETQEELAKSTSSQTKRDVTDKVEQEQLKLRTVEEAKSAVGGKLKGATAIGGTAGVELLLSDSAADAVASQLDAKDGDQVTDHKIFKDHAAKYEKDFFEDMKSLGVQRPDVVTRVTDYLPQIIHYVERIIEQGFAYDANGSVYFDTKAFIDAGHTYGKLCPWAVGNAGLASESEAKFENSDKKCGSDFALWKVSKLGEPVWESPWGLGRPGWHIECSAMASDVIGETLDVHSGGEDLRFPHHDNELAQAEAYHGCWVNYFFHSGHLHINGLKMSKSLKNFITIKQALVTYSPRQLRLLFLSQAWNKPMTFSDAAMDATFTQEKKLDSFFDNMKAILRNSNLDSNAIWANDHEEILNAADARAVVQVREKLEEAILRHSNLDSNAVWANDDHEEILNATAARAVVQVREKLEDNFDTAGALVVLLDLIKHVKLYCDKNVLSGDIPDTDLLRRVAKYVTHILVVFGLSHARDGKIGWGCVCGGIGQSSKEEIVAPYLDALVSFKADVGATALELPLGPSMDRFLALGDNFRDPTMVDLGVHLEDGVSGNSDLGWKRINSLDSDSFSSGTGACLSCKEEIAAPYLDALVSFKDDVRAAALELPPGPSKEKFLALGDKFRDHTMIDLGVQVGDKVPGNSDARWKIVDPDILRREAQKAREEKLSKLVGHQEKKMKELAKWEAAAKDPRNLFKERTQDFTSFGVDGIPTHDIRGIEVTSSSKKKLKKEMDAAKKAKDSLRQKLATDPNFVRTLKEDLTNIEKNRLDLTSNTSYLVF